MYEYYKFIKTIKYKKVYLKVILVLHFEINNVYNDHNYKISCPFIYFSSLYLISN